MLNICAKYHRRKGETSLRQLINYVSSHMNALQVLSVNVPFQDTMLNHFMLATLDAATRAWELITASRVHTPTAEIITFLDSRCRSLEPLEATQSVKALTAPSRTSQSSSSKVSTPVYSNVETQVQCPLCNGSHRMFKCDKFIKLQPTQHFTQAKH
jgi:hypothetical protein